MKHVRLKSVESSLFGKAPDILALRETKLKWLMPDTDFSILGYFHLHRKYSKIHTHTTKKKKNIDIFKSFKFIDFFQSFSLYINLFK